MTQSCRVKMEVNGVVHEVVTDTRTNLGDFLRHILELKGTHLGCEHGVCGACTVLVDGASTRSCLMLAVQANGTKITTVEGLTRPDGTLSPLQNAFWEHHALQCGFCTPGMLITITELLGNNPKPSEEEIRHAISGNLCRCTGYQSIVDAVLSLTNQQSTPATDRV